MGEVGGSFNERKNEITRKSRVCPAKNVLFCIIEGRRSLVYQDSFIPDTLYFNFPKKIIGK